MSPTKTVAIGGRLRFGAGNPARQKQEQQQEEGNGTSNGREIDAVQARYCVIGVSISALGEHDTPNSARGEGGDVDHISRNSRAPSHQDPVTGDAMRCTMHELCRQSHTPIAYAMRPFAAVHSPQTTATTGQAPGPLADRDQHRNSSMAELPAPSIGVESQMIVRSSTKGRCRD
ncbi:hypothetical protein K461DRAFT_310022 [Myriangium duriaei CBS 260.36]|uniref:Uncharacterized protein n=1 Tax=Myriangium duriaei CBS 260.36 TaxID=1168546 RepID=A0A9P4JAL2_9PEZI|nr:hypothetical protein K461DRAFT_310022 [Myriangium duriaei CBS 260.36]